MSDKGLTRYEQETIVNYNNGEKICYVIYSRPSSNEKIR